MSLKISKTKKLWELLREGTSKDQSEFRIEKVLKRMRDKLYAKWKGYDNSCNSWINENDIVKNEPTFSRTAFTFWWQC